MEILVRAILIGEGVSGTNPEESSVIESPGYPVHSPIYPYFLLSLFGFSDLSALLTVCSVIAFYNNRCLKIKKEMLPIIWRRLEGVKVKLYAFSSTVIARGKTPGSKKEVRG
jgi:hypothetical protein